ncbi:ABC transporter substrate-binding protein [Anaerobium acetethylicum]|uniref:ABC-type transport system, substrate-binding protein n=1 Tax=Anaerobium acetethylicum TaxID=1619234 RepID=A0A1D3TP44_9FIRM|nr:ABC transporter substrate-binding protein [Anaerobium acetethylicum]SCP95140.1 ABC-type transport system, substrate-binding protein [Anaerobium acetethylicum]
MKKRILSLLLVGVMVLGLAACSGNKEKEETKEETATEETKEETSGGPQVLYSNGGPTEFFETPWLNPGSYMYNKTLYDRLLMADSSLTALEGEGQMAASYTFTDDGKTLTFVLRDGIKWHDGTDITADDIKWSIEYSLKTTVLNSVFKSTFMAIDGADAYIAGTADSISGIAVDGKTITLTFSKVASDALLAFTQFAPLPKAQFEGVDPLSIQQAKFFQSPVGSGPFKVKEVQMNNYTTLEANADYWGGAANFSIYLNPSAGDSDANFVTNAKAGKLDYAYTKSIADVKALTGVEGINIEQVDVRYTRLLYVNKFKKADGSEAPLANPKVRQAIKYALDMDSILEGIFEGAAISANSLTPNGEWKAEGLNDYAYNVEKAKALLKEAGWDSNTELDVVYYYTDQATVDLMTIIQSYLSEVGIKINFRLVEGDLATILWKAPADPVNGPSAVDWDMCYAANAALSMHEYYDRYQTGYSINSHTPSDPELDKLIAATNTSTDPEVQKEAFFELQKYENETLFEIPLYYQPIFLVTSDKITEGPATIGNPQYNYNWDIQNWKLGE